MKWYISLLMLSAVLMVECGNTFIGTNVQRPMIYHHTAEFSSKFLSKRVENLYFIIPQIPSNAGRAIQGILAYDLTHSKASANITQGGLGYNFVNIRMKSERGMKLKYDIYVYA